MNQKCPVYTTVNFMGKRWTMLILLELYKGPNKWKRYSQIKGRLMDITPKILSMRLKELEKEGLLKHSVDTQEFPIKSKYRLTEKGGDFIKVINAIRRWGLKWKARNDFCEDIKSCKSCEL